MRFKTILFLALGFVFLSCEKEEEDRITYFTPWLGTYEGTGSVKQFLFNGSQTTRISDFKITVSEGDFVGTLDFYIEVDFEDPYWIRQVPINSAGSGGIEEQGDNTLETIDISIRGRQLEFYHNYVSVFGNITRDCTAIKPQS